MERFQELILRIERRARLVQGIEGVRLPLSAALLFTLGYQVLRLFGLVGAIQPYWQVSANLLSALGGFLWGYSRRVDLARVLFQADRRMGFHERLSALYELQRGRGRAEFIPILSGRLPARIEVARAVSPERRYRWLVPAALILATTLLGLPEQAPFVHRPVTEERLGERGTEPPLRKLAALEEQLAELERQVAALGSERQGGMLQERAERAQDLQEKLEEGLWGSGTDQALQGEVLEQLSQALSSLEEAGTKGNGAELPKLQADLDRLASRLTGGALKDLLQDLPQASGTEALRDLAAAQALAEGLAEAEKKLQEQGQLPSQAAGRGQGEEGVGASPQQGQQEGERPPEEGPPGGEEAGTTRGEWPAGEPSPLTVPSETHEFHISGELGELGETERLITKGTPFEAGGVEGQPSLQLDFQKVVAILESREIPDELKETVKQYFLIITEE
jgi:hypothetical protein